MTRRYVLQYGALRNLTAVHRKFGTHFQSRNNVPSKMAFKRLVDRFDRRQIRCAAPLRCARCGTSARGPKPVSEGKATQWKIREEHPSACGVYINPNSLLEAAIHDHVPRVTLRRLYPPWFDSTAREALRSKEAAFRRLRRSPSNEARRDFSEKRAVLKTLCDRRYCSYLRDLVDTFRSNPKRYWTFLKCFTKKGSLHPVLKDGDALVSDDVRRASLLNNAFASKFSDPDVLAYPPIYLFIYLLRSNHPL